MNCKFLLLFFLLFGILRQTHAQKKYAVIEIWQNNKLTSTQLNKDSLSAINEINNQISQLQSKQYFFANYTQIVKKDTLKFYLNMGQRFEQVTINEINYNDNAELIFRNIERYRGKTISSDKLSDILSNLLKSYNDRGYPFAKVEIIPNFSEASPWSSKINITQGQQVVFDTLVLLGNAKLSKSFVKHYLGIEKGELYNESKVKSIVARIKHLNFLEVSNKPIVLFQKSKAQVYVRINQKEANNINAIIGLAPQSYNNNNKLLFTGQADIVLHNLTKNREKLEVHWNSFLGNSQSLKTAIQTPYIPFLKIGASLEFDLLKFDSNYIQNRFNIGLGYLANNGLAWSLFYETENTTLLAADTTNIRNTFSFPVINSNGRRAYGLGLSYSKWQNRANPFKGFNIEARASVGTKTIKKDARIERVEFSDGNKAYSLYDSLELNFTQYEGNLNISYAIPLWKRKWVLFQSFSAMERLAPQLFFNDLYRVGGFSTLRGFDEQSIFASQLIGHNTELRYRIDDLSNLFIFYNLMAYRVKIKNYQGLKNDVPTGFGAGANIKTNNTTIQIAYAFGQEQGRKLNLNQGKFHIGLVNYF